MASVNFTQNETDRFAAEGFLIVRQAATPELCQRIRTAAAHDLARTVAPVELETSLGYPGAPASLDAAGGRTVRRLLGAADRDPAMREWATSAPNATRLAALLGAAPVLSRTHHNCMMTKHPDFGSQTNWHRDIRYWSFERPELVSLWLALGQERPENGGLLVIPGSHRFDIAPERYDAAKFLRPELPENQALIATRVPVELAAGDALFFHSRLFHAAGRNQTSEVKFSLVFTYRAADNAPLAGSRSASQPEIAL